MTFKPKGLGHVNIYVRNAERSREWYEKLLGLHTYDFEPGRAAFMSANMEYSHEVALIELGDNADGRRDGQVGLNHMAWEVNSLKDLEEFYFRMQELEVPIERVADHGLSLGIYFRGPRRQRHRSVLRDSQGEVAPPGRYFHGRRTGQRASSPGLGTR